jgi:AAA ATPase-like protein
MAQIQDEVRKFHLLQYPAEERLLTPFLSGFDVTWARRRHGHNTALSVYFLRPERFMAEMFGFAQELMLVYSPYPTLEPRALQASEQFLEDDPARGRVEKLTLLLVTEAPNPEEWVRRYLVSNQESRVIVAMNAGELRAAGGDAWYVRNKIAVQLFTRDLFDFRLPLERDTYFFGRDDLLLDYRDAARRGENRGLFGLRKTGKTSFLFKLQRFLSSEGAHVIYYDCKSPSIRQLHWHELLEKVGQDLAARHSRKFKTPADNRRYAEVFTNLLAKAPEDQRTLLVFDEIEYISPFAIVDEHWKTEYLTFWQTIWAAQSVHRRISVLIAGVNPSVVEIDRIAGTQNPLFGIVPYHFLTGLDSEEVRRMLRVLGKRMGLTFSDEATEYMFQRYGGHPLLTRLAASYMHKRAASARTPRPLQVDASELQTSEDQRDGDLSFYCGHVVSELKDFYPDEYTLLEWLSAGRAADYLEFANYPDHIRHLRAYGLVTPNTVSAPRVTLSVIARYVALEEARREGRKTILRLVNAAEREPWLDRRKRAILDDLAELERVAESAGLASLFGPNSFPESHRFSSLSVVADEAGFEIFINCCHRCFVEAIEAFGRHLRKSDYFWTEIRAAYPSLQEALHRIRVYRHHRMHIKLNPGVEAALERFLKQDLESREPAGIDDLWFLLQQATLDAMFNGLQVELSRLGR